MLVRCIKNGSTSRIFTDGKIYEARHFKNALYEIHDDLGHSRYIIPDEPCPHLVREINRPGWYPAQVVVGRFEEVR